MATTISIIFRNLVDSDPEPLYIIPMMNDDNYGQWENEGNNEDRAETMAFYRHCADRSVEKVCSICSMCGRQVMLMPHYDKCDACCRWIEIGWQF